jgi:hypothetical protein
MFERRTLLYRSNELPEAGHGKDAVAQVPRPNGPFELVERDIPEPPLTAGRESRCRPAASVTAIAKLMGGK